MATQENQSDTDLLMEDMGESLGYIQEYVSHEVEGIKLDIAEKISIASSTIITVLAITAIGSIVVIFLSIALGFYLGNLFQSYTLGFSLVAAVFFILLLFVYFFRKALITDQVVTAVIQLLFDKENDEIDS